MRTGSTNNWWTRSAGVLAFLMLCLPLLGSIGVMGAQTQPDPRPQTVPYFYDPSDVFPEDQEVTLARDAQLLQSMNIPTVVYVRTASAEEAEAEPSRAFADTVRREWDVETAPGADDGLLILLSYVPDSPEASTVVASWGESTFEGSGLTPEYVQSVLDRDVRTLLDMGFPFEAMVYGLRQIRYGGIYLPPPPAPLEGTAQALHNVLGWVGPALAMVAVAGFIILSIRQRPARRMPQALVWKVAGLTGAIVFLLALLSVWGRSRIGIGSALLILIALAIYVWFWTHPSKPRSRNTRRRSVPPTNRRLRKRRQAQRMMVAKVQQ